MRLGMIHHQGLGNNRYPIHKAQLWHSSMYMHILMYLGYVCMLYILCNVLYVYISGSQPFETKNHLYILSLGREPPLELNYNLIMEVHILIFAL